jgi:hypothetical protein
MAITSAVPGQTLFGNVGLWVNGVTGYAYQLMRNGAVFQSGSWGSQDPSYTVQSSDVGTVITITVTASNSSGAGPPTQSVSVVITSPPPVLILNVNFSGSAHTISAPGANTADGLASPIWNNITGSTSGSAGS